MTEAQRKFIAVFAGKELSELDAAVFKDNAALILEAANDFREDNEDEDEHNSGPDLDGDLDY